MSAHHQIFTTVIHWLVASTSLVALSASVWMAIETLGLTINIDKGVFASSVLHSTATTEGSVNIKMDRKFACKCVCFSKVTSFY